MKQDVFDAYVEKVSEFYSIDKEKIFTKFVGKEASDARQMIWWMCDKRHIRPMYIAKHTLRHGLKVAASTISHGILAFESRIQQDDDLIKIIERIENSIKA